MLARLLRSYFSFGWIAGGTIIVGVAIASVRLGSAVATGDIGIALSKLSNVHHGYLAGWAISIGLISAFFLARQFGKPRVSLIIGLIIVSSLGVFLFFQTQ